MTALLGIVISSDEYRVVLTQNDSLAGGSDKIRRVQKSSRSKWPGVFRSSCPSPIRQMAERIHELYTEMEKASPKVRIFDGRESD